MRSNSKLNLFSYYPTWSADNYIIYCKHSHGVLQYSIFDV